MKTNAYIYLKSKVNELNRINDEISLIEWNKDDGPKFSSVEEMKDFIAKVNNDEFDYLIGSDKEESHSDNDFIEKFDYTIDDMFFFIYTFKSNQNYITYLNLKNLKDDDTLNNLYGYKTTDINDSHSYFEKLTSDIKNNSLDYILENMIIDVENNIKRLKTKYEKLVSES